MAGGNQTSEYRMTRNASYGLSLAASAGGAVAYTTGRLWEWIALAAAALIAAALVIAAYALSRSKVKQAEATASGELAIAQAHADGEVRKAEAIAAPMRAAVKPYSRSV